ncbi:hypothetical protein NQ314_018480 [Rhamnusium bicolor]|uniref:Uncharacterized protein n=1 Tax=Rhamnusium bicolor TaxID=1586634 RepID=A0AAV8WR25_9CUCU|nr:hypothetical protein NQ314_018480 [Rhamnusium bicolor]
MGIKFIGNPFDQENDYDDSDWEMNADEEWVTPPEEIALVDVLERTEFSLILAAGAESSGEESDPNWQESNDDDSDEDYIPDEDDDPDNEVEDFVSEQNDHYFYDDTDDEDIDYVTYPTNDQPSTETDKPATDDSTNTRENNDLDCV